MSICQSDRYVIYSMPRENENDPFIIHVRDMINGTDKTYDLCELADEPISTEIRMFFYTRGAIVFHRPTGATENAVSFKTHELDLESGRVYKYDVPAA